jgi:putative transcriptional regulator
VTLPNYHPSDALLMAYAAGSLDEGQSLVVATHIQLCPSCRRRLRLMEALGGALLENLPPEPVKPDCFAKVLAHLGEDETETPRRPCAFDAEIPEPLRAYTDALSDTWHQAVTPGGRAIDIRRFEDGTGSVRLVRMEAGARMPAHLHSGNEVTLILSGGLTDETSHFERGDLIEVEEGEAHTPTACPKRGCLCLIADSAPPRFIDRA